MDYLMGWWEMIIIVKSDEVKKIEHIDSSNPIWINTSGVSTGDWFIFEKGYILFAEEKKCAEGNGGEYLEKKNIFFCERDFLSIPERAVSH